MRHVRLSAANLIALGVASGCLLLLLGACNIFSPKSQHKSAAGETIAQMRPMTGPAVALGTPPACAASIAITSRLPADSALNQDAINCFAWQSFIALNWPLASNVGPGGFGQPGDESPTVWQGYKATQDVFLPGATPPAPWGTPNGIPGPCQGKAGRQANRVVLYMTAKASDDQPLNDLTEATGQILVDQTLNLIRFEKRINEAEFDYITNNQLYNGDNQFVVASRQGLNLPSGAIEIKAAWRRLDGQPANVKARYKQTEALLYNAGTGQCEGPVTMGLIALHIIRKTDSMPDLMWSTFEQVDNVPGGANHPADLGYTLYNPNCLKPAPCTANAAPQPTPAPPATPVYEPVQVTRMLGIPTDVQGLNGAVQKAIAQASPASVWQYYQLINVTWPQGGGTNLTPGAIAPINLDQAQFTSSGPQPVSNVALETYSQTTDCLTCHAAATIAASKAATCNPRLAADFSFVLDDADTPNHFRTSCPKQ